MLRANEITRVGAPDINQSITDLDLVILIHSDMSKYTEPD
jgi:hypothetical protein